MPLRVIGAGLGRTGTTSLKVALERLLGAPCYHMHEVFAHPEHIPLWHRIVRGETPDWERLFNGYAAAVDWPACSFWAELAEHYPAALVLLSNRPAREWWESANATIFPAALDPDPSGKWDAWHEMFLELLGGRFTWELADEHACIAAFERHYASIRSGVPADRLLEWRPSDGWQPLCAALGMPVPAEPFPHKNTRAEFLSDA